MSADAVRLTLAPVKALDSGKIVSAEEAASLIRDGDTIATGGFVGIGFAEEVALAIETSISRRGMRRFLPPTSRVTSRWSTPQVKVTVATGDLITLGMKVWCAA